MPTLIALTPDTRGDVPAEVTHLVEVSPPRAGELNPEFYTINSGKWWFDPWLDEPSDGSCAGDPDYRCARRATQSEIDATRAEASPSVGRDELEKVCHVGLKAIDMVLAQYELFVGPDDAIANAVKAEAHDAMRFLRAALAAAGHTNH
jgi:hypothetical protein